MKRRNLFYVWLLPLIWAVCSYIHFFYPGDEYMVWGYSSIAGTWIFFVTGWGDFHNPLFPVAIAATGAVVMAAVGLLMDRLRVRKVLWGAMFAIAAVVVFVASLKAFPSIEKALSKHGSWMAYICSSINLAIYLSVIASVPVALLERIWKKLK
jgi:hypothetical protein